MLFLKEQAMINRTHPMQAIVLDENSVPRFRKNLAVVRLVKAAEGRASAIPDVIRWLLAENTPGEDMDQLVQLYGESVEAYSAFTFHSVETKHEAERQARVLLQNFVPDQLSWREVFDADKVMKTFERAREAAGESGYSFFCWTRCVYAIKGEIGKSIAEIKWV
jgi:hypothetical protein